MRKRLLLAQRSVSFRFITHSKRLLRDYRDYQGDIAQDRATEIVSGHILESWKQNADFEGIFSMALL